MLLKLNESDSVLGAYHTDSFTTYRWMAKGECANERTFGQATLWIQIVYFLSLCAHTFFFLINIIWLWFVTTAVIIVLIVASSPQDMFKYGARFCSLILSIWFRFVLLFPFIFELYHFFQLLPLWTEFSTNSISLYCFTWCLKIVIFSLAIFKMKGALISALVFVFFSLLWSPSHLMPFALPFSNFFVYFAYDKLNFNFKSSKSLLCSLFTSLHYCFHSPAMSMKYLFTLLMDGGLCVYVCVQ